MSRLSVFVLLLFAGCASGGPGLKETLDSVMRDYQGEVPGASVLVVRDGRVIAQESWGFADLDSMTRATPRTNYRLASVTKQFTAASILLLAEDGALTLDDPVGKWLPSLPTRAAGVRVRHLLSHTSGLLDYEDLVPDDAVEQIHDRDVLELLETQDELYFEPGTRYRYSNSGYALLALVIARASGMSFAEFLKERIFEPLAMHDTVAFEEGVSVVSNRAYGHSLTAKGWQRDDQSITSAVLGDGGIYSSVVDLARWDAALNDDRLLRDDSRRLLFTPVIATDRPGVSYGMGWRLSGGTAWHTGETRGFSNAIIRDPASRTTVIVLTNRDEGEPYALAKEILALVGRASPPDVSRRPAD